MKIDYRFIQANIGNILGLIALVLSYVFQIDRFVDYKAVLMLTAVGLYINNAIFEYQRITLILARCIKVKAGIEENISVFDIQELLASSMLGFILFLENIVFGIIVGYLLRTSLVYVAIVLFAKYIALAWISLPTPYSVFFRLIDKQIVYAGRELITSGRMNLMLILVSTYREMPHDKNYEDWAFIKYGNILIAQK